jgi:hypothetical protein
MAINSYDISLLPFFYFKPGFHQKDLKLILTVNNRIVKGYNREPIPKPFFIFTSIDILESFSLAKSPIVRLGFENCFSIYVYYYLFYIIYYGKKAVKIQ